MIMICLIIFTGCKENNIETDQTIEIETLTKEIVELKNYITEVSENDLTLENNEMIYRIKEIQSLKGIMELKGNESLKFLPNRKAEQIGNINSGKVKIIATVINNDNEEWVLVESLDPNNSTKNPFGFISVSELKEIDIFEKNNDIKSELPFFDDISMGISKEDALKKLGPDYVEVKTREGQFIHYFGESLPIDKREYFIEGQEDAITNLETGIDLFFDINTSTMHGFRILSTDYKLFNTWTIGDDVDDLIESISSEFKTYVEPGYKLSKDQYLYDINENYFLRIVFDTASNKIIILHVEKKEF